MSARRDRVGDGVEYAGGQGLRVRLRATTGTAVSSFLLPSPAFPHRRRRQFVTRFVRKSPLRISTLLSRAC